MEQIKDPRTWKQIALDGTITDFNEDSEVEPDNTDIGIITQLISDGIPNIKKDADSETYYITFDNKNLEIHNFQQETQEYLEDNTLEIKLQSDQE